MKIYSQISITHILFIDDVIICGDGKYSEWRSYNSILRLFNKTTGMQINILKFVVLENNLSQDTIDAILDDIPFKIQDIVDGTKYLFFL